MRLLNRRNFISLTSGGALGIALPSCAAEVRQPLKASRYSISIAQWSLHRSLRNGDLTNMQFPAKAASWGIGAVEYVNSFFERKEKDNSYLNELKMRCDDAGVRSLLIMCDGEGHLGDPDSQKRKQAVENHVRWLAAAQHLGCHSIRVNAASSGSRVEQANFAADGLRALCERASAFNLHVIVENHGGLSSDGSWLAEVIQAVDHPRAGTLPDFGNFHLGGGQWYDRYQGVKELMPFAKAVSAKSHDFDHEGNETRTNYSRMLEIVTAAGYSGWIGIEYEGSNLSEEEGILATRNLLERYQFQA